jgi:hypothetical protein
MTSFWGAIPASRQAAGVAFLCVIDTPIWRSSVTIYSALNLVFGITQAPFLGKDLVTPKKRIGAEQKRLFSCAIRAIRRSVIDDICAWDVG